VTHDLSACGVSERCDAYSQIDPTISATLFPPAVPEPSTLAQLALGGGGLAGWRRWRKRKAAQRIRRRFRVTSPR
jgi:hypothetical protein